MQADAEIGQAAGAADRVLRRIPGDHEAGGIEYAVAMGALYAFIDGFGEAEIVRGEGKPAQAALCRSRRNWKNSTPSRRRRTIICGLVTISPTMEAIFGARK